MQSDLSNASTKLRLYQTENGVLPTTAANAIAAKLISPNPSMDYYSYGVDNISNPQYFCYMYREGTDVYAVDSYSAPSKGVCLTNLVTNGDFSLDGNFDGSADDWGVFGTSKSVANNIQRMTPNSAGSAVLGHNFTNIINHIYYYGIKLKTDSALVNLNNGFIKVNHTGSNTFELLSWVNKSTGSGTPHQGMYDDRASGWTELQVKEAIRIDLTDIYGTGREPTKAQMDVILGAYSSSWFNTVVRLSL
jgi:hypothetical protein